MVEKVLEEELKYYVYDLEIVAKTPAEWKKKMEKAKLQKNNSTKS